MDFFKMCSGIPIQIADSQKGDRVVVLLHGYMETMSIWEAFADLLKHKVRVISLDLPGCGMSGVLPNQSIEGMADVVAEVLVHCGVKSASIVGHSMGGYVALAFADKYEAMTDHLCLFHSDPKADSEEKKALRDREARLIDSGKLELILLQSIRKMFAEQNVARLEEQIEEIIENAMISGPEGTLACLYAMRNRPDKCTFLSKWTKPALIVLGRFDIYIPIEDGLALTNTLPNCRCVVLEQSGHSGFLEESELMTQILLEALDGIVNG